MKGFTQTIRISAGAAAGRAAAEMSRFIAGIKMHTQGMTVDEATNLSRHGAISRTR